MSVADTPFEVLKRTRLQKNEKQEDSLDCPGKKKARTRDSEDTRKADTVDAVERARRTVYNQELSKRYAREQYIKSFITKKAGRRQAEKAHAKVVVTRLLSATPSAHLRLPSRRGENKQLSPCSSTTKRPPEKAKAQLVARLKSKDSTLKRLSDRLQEAQALLR